MEINKEIVLNNLEFIRKSREKNYKHVIFNFEDIRKCFISNSNGTIHQFLTSQDGRETINRGRKSLENIEECIQYWYLYCKNFVPQPWKILSKIYGHLHMYKQSVEVYDYASGQGQATFLLLDNFYNDSNRSEEHTSELQSH